MQLGAARSVRLGDDDALSVATTAAAESGAASPAVSAPPSEDHGRRRSLSGRHAAPSFFSLDDSVAVESCASERSDDSLSSRTSVAASARGAPLPAPTQVACLQALATCLFAQRQVQAELSVLRDLVGLLDADGSMAVGSAEARKKVMVQRRIGSCLLSLEQVGDAVDAFRVCVAEGERLLPAVRPPPPTCTFINTVHMAAAGCAALQRKAVINRL